MKTYRAAVIGCSRMGGFIDNEVRAGENIVLPYSHAAGYLACECTDLVACADLREDVMAEFGKAHQVPKEGQYTDYREMLAREEPDIVSVATQPEPRAEIVVYAVEHGARAIYAEKAMAASMEEADAMVAAVEKNGAVLNLGTNRRWDPGYDKMKEIIDSGELGALETLIIYDNSRLFNGSSHTLDLILRLNDDVPATWVQGHLPEGDEIFAGDVLRQDPLAEGIIQFANGVKGYALLTARRSEFEAVCTKGTLTAFNNGQGWRVRRFGTAEYSGSPMPEYERASSTLRLVEDLVHALDTGEPPRGGVRVARANNELIFAFIESHRRGGARVELPLSGSRVRLQRQHTPRQPRYAS